MSVLMVVILSYLTEFILLLKRFGVIDSFDYTSRILQGQLHGENDAIWVEGVF